MGIISFLIKLFFFYMVFSIISGLWKVYQTYRLVQKQAAQGPGQGDQRTTYTRSESQSFDGETIEAEFKVVDEKDI